MRVLQDDGVNRQVCFKRADGFETHFMLVAIPYYLTIISPHGVYVFRRDWDMFELFADAEIDYMHSKLVSQDVHSPAREFSEDVFTKYVQDNVDSYLSYVDLPSTEDHAAYRLRLEASVDVLLLNGEIGTVEGAMVALQDFVFDDFDFTDVEVRDLMDYNFHFKLSCEAIKFGIARYNELEGKENE